jgi:hypothetical protein
MAVGVFAIAMARLLRRLLKPVTTTASLVHGELSLEVPSLLAPSANLVGLTALVCLAYIGIAAGSIGNIVIGVLCTAASWFLVAWKEDRPDREAKPFRIGDALILLLCMILAGGVSFVSLLPRLGGSGSVASKAQSPKNRDNGASLDRLQSGIILTAKPKAFIPLIVPHPDTLRKARKQLYSRTLKIPFSGEYWFFRWPLLRPPASSLRVQGNDPTRINAKLQDFGALVMQARQKIGRSIDARCCHSINVVLHGVDRQPETVWMELILVNSSATKNNSQTLGAQILASPQTVSVDSSTGIKSSTFRFAIPTHPAIQSFDSLIVWFHLGPPRTREGATVSVDEFELITE